MFTHNSQPRKRKRSNTSEPVPRSKQHRNETNRLLDKLTNETNDMLDIVLSCPIGALKIAGEKAKSLGELKKEEEWLKRQLEFYRMAKLKKQSSDWNVAPDETELTQQIQELQKEVYKENNKLQNHKLILKRAEEHDLLLNVVYADDETDDEEVRNLKEVIREALALRDSKVITLAQVSTTARQIDEELSCLQKKVELLAHQNRKKLQDLDPTAIVNLNDQSLLQLDIHETLQHVLQTLILSTGVDWSQDPELRAIMTGPTTFDYTK